MDQTYQRSRRNHQIALFLFVLSLLKYWQTGVIEKMNPLRFYSSADGHMFFLFFFLFPFLPCFFFITSHFIGVKNIICYQLLKKTFWMITSSMYDITTNIMYYTRPKRREKKRKALFCPCYYSCWYTHGIINTFFSLSLPRLFSTWEATAVKHVIFMSCETNEWRMKFLSEKK